MKDSGEGSVASSGRASWPSEPEPPVDYAERLASFDPARAAAMFDEAFIESKTSAPRPTGPRTPQGKSRSALNAVRHGLAGAHLLLPGENETEYAARMDAVFTALSPKNEAEAQLVALFGDDLWKAARLSKIEQGLLLGRVEELLAQTTTGKEAARIANAVMTLGEALTAWERSPISAEHTPALLLLYRAMNDAISFVRANVSELSADLFSACDDALGALWGKRSDDRISKEAYEGVYRAAHAVMRGLMQVGDRAMFAEDELRKAVSTIALPDEKELKKVQRYRAMLEASIQRRLAALDQLRKMTQAEAPTERDVERAREYFVKLRLVG